MLPRKLTPKPSDHPPKTIKLCHLADVFLNFPGAISIIPINRGFLMDPRHRKSTKPNMSCKHCLTSLISWSNVSCFLGGNGILGLVKEGYIFMTCSFSPFCFCWFWWLYDKDEELQVFIGSNILDPTTLGRSKKKSPWLISPHPNSQNQLNNSTKESKVVIPIGWVTPSKWKGWPTTKTPWLTNTYWISLFVSLDSLSKSLKEIP